MLPSEVPDNDDCMVLSDSYGELTLELLLSDTEPDTPSEDESGSVSFDAWKVCIAVRRTVAGAHKRTALCTISSLGMILVRTTIPSRACMLDNNWRRCPWTTLMIEFIRSQEAWERGKVNKTIVQYTTGIFALSLDMFAANSHAFKASQALIHPDFERSSGRAPDNF